MKLYFLHFRNYYNRRIKKFDSIFDYAPYFSGSPIVNALWNPGDGVETQQVLNLYDQTLDSIPNYLVVTDDNDVINSRWYVMDGNYNRKGQYILGLRRDLLADHLEEVLSEQAFIEKAWIKDISDPAIYNSESLALNQILQSKTPLYDDTYCPWLVGYIQKLAEDKTISVVSEDTAALRVTTLESWSGYQYISNNYNGHVEWEQYKVRYDDIYNNELYFSAKIGDTTYTTQRKSSSEATRLTKGSIDLAAFVANKAVYNAELFGEVGSTYLTDANCIAVDNYNGIFIHVTTGTTAYPAGLYRISARWGLPIRTTHVITENGACYLDMKNSWTTYGGTYKTATISNNKSFQITFSYEPLYMEAVSVPQETLQLTLKASHKPTSDAAYDIIAMPYGDYQLSVGGYSRKSTGLTMLSQMCTSFGKTMYDAQIVPYCPLTNNIKRSADGKSLTISNLTEHKDYEFITKGGDKVGICFFVSNSSFSFTKNLDTPELAPLKKVYTNAHEQKIDNETLKYRICSPNYAAAFEFSPAKNNGFTSFTVSATYKPGIPYIRVSPNFGGLYGRTYQQDNRGLILSGDFSITRVDDAYVSYINDNKNYSLIFDRQIENMEFTQAEQMKQLKFNAITGAFTGGFTAAAGGALAAGAIGAGVAGVLGAGAGVAGGILDIEAAKRTFAETLDYTKDLYNYNLQNIQAMPKTLSRVSAYNIDNLYVPFIEVYDCTETEKRALINKIIYNGMTIMRIGQLKDFVDTEEEHYYKIRMIRVNEESEDFHEYAELSAEANKGFFIVP